MEKLIKNKVRAILPVYKIFFYIMLGALWSLANVGYSIGFITWFGLVPYLFIIRNEKFKHGILYSMLFGFSVYFFHFLWLPDAIYTRVILEVFPIWLTVPGFILSWLIMSLIALYHGLMYVIIYIAARYVSKKLGFYLYFPIIYTVLDSVFPKMFVDRLGYSQYMFFEFTQSVDLFGVPLITFLLISSNVSVIMIIEALIFKKGREIAFTSFLLVILAISGLSAYGSLRIKEIDKLKATSDTATVSIVQANITGEGKILMQMGTIIDKYNGLTEALTDPRPDLVVWPETSIPSILYTTVNNLTSIIKVRDYNILFGTHVVRMNSQHNYSLFNALVLSDTNGQKADAYYKNKLLPFVEHIPIRQLNFLFKIVGFTPFSEGFGPSIMTVGKIRLTPNICYESLNSSYILDSMNIKDTSANLIVNATNDSWFGNSIEPKMHFHMARFRAIETRRTMVRSTCTGYSAIIDPTGKPLMMTGLFTEETLTSQVPLLSEDTIYMKWGRFFIWVLSIILILLIIYRRIVIYKITEKRKQKLALVHHQTELKKMWYD